MEADMSFSRAILRSSSLFVLTLFFSVGITGQDEQPKNELSTFPCGPKAFTVSPTFGVTPYVIYICDGDEVTWKGNNHKFKVTFKGNKCPFNETCDDIGDTNPNPDIKKHA